MKERSVGIGRNGIGLVVGLGGGAVVVEGNDGGRYRIDGIVFGGGRGVAELRDVRVGVVAFLNVVETSQLDRSGVTDDGVPSMIPAFVAERLGRIVDDFGDGVDATGNGTVRSGKTARGRYVDFSRGRKEDGGFFDTFLILGTDGIDQDSLVIQNLLACLSNLLKIIILTGFVRSRFLNYSFILRHWSDGRDCSSSSCYCCCSSYCCYSSSYCCTLLGRRRSSNKCNLGASATSWLEMTSSSSSGCCCSSSSWAYPSSCSSARS